MKHTPWLLGLLLSALLLAACGQTPEDGGTGEQPLAGETVLTCRVVTVQDGQLLLAQEDGRATDVYTLAVGETPVTYEDPGQTAIQPGDLVQIGFNGMVEETFPAQLGEVEAIQVQADGRDDLCALYLQALADLWEVDEALNRDIVQLGMDLSQTRLSPAEQGAVAVAFGRQQGLPVLQNTWQELADQGYIDQENLVWEDGLFLSITEEDPQADQLTFTVQKWRSGLGAYFFTDCTAQQAKDGSWGDYTVGAEAVA